jgi:hypothetical protein
LWLGLPRYPPFGWSARCQGQRKRGTQRLKLIGKPRSPAYFGERTDHCVGRLAAAGGPELDPDELWLRYREGSGYAYVASLITAGMGGMQDESIALEGVRRGVAALSDLETVAALKRSLS